MTPRRPTNARVEGGHDEEHGVDSATFYDNQDASQSEFISSFPVEAISPVIRTKSGTTPSARWLSI